VAECEVEPAEFDCRAQCQGDCQARAEGSCSAGDGQAECLARAEASCDAECSGSCEIEPGTANCEATCQGSCEASCEASGEAYLDCQAECQGPQFGECTAELEGGCKVDCNTEEGALFCDGSYIDHGNNLAECRAALRAIFEIEVRSGGEASCSGNECEASGFLSCSCTTDPDNVGRDTALLTLAGLFLFGVARRRRRVAA
jgi:MYXO-CTERM domain-containing protein